MNFHERLVGYEIIRTGNVKGTTYRWTNHDNGTEGAAFVEFLGKGAEWLPYGTVSFDVKTDPVGYHTVKKSIARAVMDAAEYANEYRNSGKNHYFGD
jgi:hypothetical protein